MTGRFRPAMGVDHCFPELVRNGLLSLPSLEDILNELILIIVPILTKA